MNWPLKRKKNGPAQGSNGHIIEMRDITKVYDTGKIKVEALRGIDLEVHKGEFVAVVGPSGSCLSMFVNHYPELLRTDVNWHKRALALSGRSFELIDFISKFMASGALKARYRGIVTYHDSCTGLRELNLKEQPRMLLSQVRGLEIREMESAETCCGFGGSFSVKFPDISTRLVDDKIHSILKTGADTVTGGDLGCLMNIFGRLNRLKKDIKVFHVAEILAGMAAGGPLGRSLKKSRK